MILLFYSLAFSLLAEKRRTALFERYVGFPRYTNGKRYTMSYASYLWDIR